MYLLINIRIGYVPVIDVSCFFFFLFFFVGGEWVGGWGGKM